MDGGVDIGLDAAGAREVPGFIDPALDVLAGKAHRHPCEAVVVHQRGEDLHESRWRARIGRVLATDGVKELAGRRDDRRLDVRCPDVDREYIRFNLPCVACHHEIVLSPTRPSIRPDRTETRLTAESASRR